MAGSSGAIATEGPAYEASTVAWYNEINNWDFSTSAGNGGGVTGHFTQVVWKNSQQVNCGYSTYLEDYINRYIVVCQYYPNGNYDGEYAANVAPIAALEFDLSGMR